MTKTEFLSFMFIFKNKCTVINPAPYSRYLILPILLFLSKFPTRTWQWRRNHRIEKKKKYLYWVIRKVRADFSIDGVQRQIWKDYGCVHEDATCAIAIILSLFYI